MIEVINLTKKYGDHVAVNHLNFTIEPGRVYGFLGPNGAGKSTTMNMITGCLAPTNGQVIINGHDIFDDAVAAKKEIGYLPEIPPVYPEMTPYEYLRFVAEAKGIKPAEIPAAVVSVMEETDIFERRNRLIKNLSKGFRQRVGIAQAMLGNPSLIILDEPTVGLDPRQIIEIRELIKRLGEKRTIILSSHILSEVQAVCDYVMIINQGNLVASDTLENIRAQYAQDNVFYVTARANKDGIEKILGKIEGIVSFDIYETADKNVFNIKIDANSGAELGEKLFRAFADANFVISRLEKYERSLEEVFLSLTEKFDEQAEETEAKEENGDNSDDNSVNDEKDDDEENNSSDEYKPLFGGKGDDNDIRF